jgi:hypothetical protein
MPFHAEAFVCVGVTIDRPRDGSSVDCQCFGRKSIMTASFSSGDSR